MSKLDIHFTILLVVFFLSAQYSSCQPNTRVSDWTRGGTRYALYNQEYNSTYLAAVPTMHEARNSDGDVVNGFFLFKSGVGYRTFRRDVSRDKFDWEPSSLFRKAHLYARRYSSYSSGFPTFEYYFDNSGNRYLGIMMFYKSKTITDYVSARQLGVKDEDMESVERRFRIVGSLERPGYVAIPNFYDVVMSSGKRYGITYVRNTYVDHEDVPRFQFYHLINFRYAFDPQTSFPTVVPEVMSAHILITKYINQCTYLQPDERDTLKEFYLNHQVYHRDLFYPRDSAGFLRSAQAYNRSHIPQYDGDGEETTHFFIDMNLAHLFSLNGAAIKQTLIHEMMHLAGYDHPLYSGGNTQCTPSGIKRPYFSTAPLRAECCIPATVRARKIMENVII